MNRRLIVRILLALAFLLALGTTGLAAARPQLARTYLVPFSSMVELEPGLYIDPQMPEAQRRQFLADLDAARGRVAGLFGSPVQARTTIIASGDSIRRIEASH